MNTKLITLLFFIAMLAGFSAHAVLSTNWPFTTASQYAVSDSNKIEVADGVAKLKLEAKHFGNASYGEYLTNNTQLTSLVLGQDASIGLMSSNGIVGSVGTFISRVIDGGAGNVWNGLSVKASNRTLGSHSVWETSPAESNNVVAIYHFNGAWTDAVSGSNGVPVSSPVFTNTAVFGSQALYVNGGNSFTTVNPSLLSGATEFTVSCWIKLSSASQNSGIIASGLGAQTLGIYYINGLFFLANDADYITSPSGPPMNVWLFVVGTYKSGSQFVLYLNGSPIASKSAGVLVIAQTDPFHIGVNPASGRFASAIFDEVAIYNRALSAAEVQALYLRGGSLGVQVRSGATTPLSGSFAGPDGKSSTYFMSDSSLLNVAGRYLQYQLSIASDNIQSPYLESVRLTGTAGTFIDDVWGDFVQGTCSQSATILPTQVATPFVTLAKGLQGVNTNGTFTSRVFDAGGGVNWNQIGWTRGYEVPSTVYGMVGLWHLNQDLADATGNGHNGTMLGSLAYSPLSKLGDYSAVFNGVDAAVNFGSFQSSLQSLEFWVKADKPAANILECDSASSWVSLSNQMITVNGWAGTPPKIYVNSRQSPQLLPGWNHVAIVYPSTFQATNMVVGFARGNYFSGSLDELAVYSRALTSAEVAQHYVTGLRDTAGRIRMQVRADNLVPPQTAFVGPDGTPSTYFLSSSGSPVPISLSGKQFFQYQATLEGDGTAGPALLGVTVQYGAGQSTGDYSSVDFGAGIFGGTLTRLHGDEMSLRPLSSSGGINLDSTISPFLIGLWHLDDLQWTIGSATVVDSSGYSRHGTPLGTASVVDNGIVGSRCGSFATDGYVTIPGMNLAAADFTVSAWFKTTSATRSAVFSTYNGAGQPYYSVEVNGDGSLTKVGLTTFVVSDATSTILVRGNRTNLNDGVWHHLSAVRNGQQAHLYIDGLLAGTAPLGVGFGSVGNAQLTIAKYGSQSIFFTGNIDEVAVHGRALTEGEIGDLAALGVLARDIGQFTGPIVDAGQVAYWETINWGADAPYGRPLRADSSTAGLWHFESLSNNIVVDSSGNGNDGSVTAGASLSVNGRFSNGLSLAGGQQVTVNDSPLLRVASFSAETWINPSNAVSLTVAQKMSGGTGFTLGTDASGRPYLTVNGATVTDPDILRARKWNLLCGTHDGTTARLYVNGLLKGAVTVSGSALNSTSLIIGSGIAGLIDEAVLYNRVLNAEEARDHYRAGVGTLKFQVRSFSGSPQGNFVGYDGTTNTFLTDLDGSSLVGVVPINQYFQYKATMGTEDARFSPKLDSVRVDASAYPVDNPWVAPADGFGSSFYGNLTAFSDVMATTNSAAVQYQISGNNGTNWYAWSGGTWIDVTGYTNSSSQWAFSNSRSTINANIGSFYNQFYQGVGGVFKFRAFLKSDAIQQVALDEVDLSYSKGRLLLTSPNGLEVSNNAWVVSVPYNITWTSSGSVTATNIIIELYNQSGANYVKMIAAGVTNSGVYRSVINTDPGTNYRIRIRDGSDPTIYDWSDNDFELIYNLHLSVPNGGEKWYLGDTNNVSWESPLGTEMSLWLSNDGGSNNWVEVTRAIAAVGTNGFPWVIQTHNAMLPSMTAKMAVSTPDVATPFLAPFYDLSDNPFVMAGAVVTYPNVSTGVKMGDTINVLWTSAAAGPNVMIELFDGSAWTNLAASAPNVDGTNSYPCQLNAPNPTEAALIRITSLSDGRIVAISDAFLLADIRILSPKGGTPLSRDRWQIGTTNLITWVAGGAGNLVNVDYSTDGVTWKSIAANYVNTNSSGSAVVTNFAPPWLILGPPSSGAVVRVSSVARPDLQAKTDFFDIAGVQVVSPNGGEYWEFTGTNIVQWLYQGAGFNIGIGITYNGGATTNDYVTLDPSLSIFSGTRTIVPGRLLRPSSLAKIRLVANDTLGYPIPMTDVSDGYFTIRGLSVFMPTTNAVYTMGTTVTDGLQWYSAATEDPSADLYYSSDGSNYNSLIVGGTPNIDAGSSWNHINWAVSRSLIPSKTARVKVIAGTYQAVSPVFTLRGIRVTQPAAGQIFDLGSRQFIYWTAAGLSDNAYMSNVVSVTGQGGVYVSGGLPGNTFVRNAALTWNIDPDLDPSTNVVVKMIVTTPTNDTDIIMYSDPFILRGAKILSPSTGTNWMIGTQRSIVYSAAGMAPAAVGDIYYSADGGATFDMSHAVANNVPMNSGINSVVWNIENTSTLSRQPSTNAVLMLISGTVTNLSKPFRMGGIKVTAPKATDIWAVSDLTNTIQWVGVDTQPSFSLFYTVYDAPQHSGAIASGVPGFAYNWAMTSNAIGNQVTITITDGVTTNESPKFVVVPSPSIRLISPAAGDFWKVGETNNIIQWVQGGNMSNDFTVGYSPYPFMVTNTIATGPFQLDAGIFSFNWGPIPNSLGQVRLVVVNNRNANIVDSQDNFRIAPTFQIQPFIGSLHALEPKDVNWTTLGSVSGVDFYYSTDPFRGTNSWTLINAAGPFTGVAHFQASSYLWNVPNIKSGTVWFRIQDHTYLGTTFDASKKGPYDDLGMFEVLYYTVVWRIYDSATSNELNELSVTDSSGWSSSGLASPLSHDYPYGFWNTVWFKQYYNDKIILNWSSKTVLTNSVYMTVTQASPEYHVMASFVYDPLSSVFKTVAWLERSSQIIPDPTECNVYIYDPDGNLVQTVGAGAPRASGVFWADVGALLDKNRPYFAKVEIKHSGVIYTSGITFTLLTPADSAIAAVNSARDAILGSVSNVNNNVTGVGNAVTAMQTDVTNRLTSLSNTTAQISLDTTGIKSNLASFSSNTLAQLSGLTNTIGVIGPGGTNLLDQVRILTQNVDKRTARIMTRPGTVKSGNQATILYRSQPGLAVTLSVANSLGVQQLSIPAMAELSGGVYESTFTFNALWGLGDFMVTCTDASGASDRIIMKVAGIELDDLAGSMTGISNQLAGVELSLSNMSVSVSNINHNVGVVTNDLTGMILSLDSISNVMGQVAGLTNMANSVSALTSAVAQVTVLTNMSGQLSFITNAVGSLGSLTNLTPQMASLSNSMARLQLITNTMNSMSAQMTYLTNVIDQIVILTNINPAVAAMTSAVAQISGLTNMASQLNYLTNAVGSLTTLTNLNPQMAFLTNITANTALQTQYLTNLLGRMGGLTNLTPQMGYLTNAVAQLQSLTNLNDQVAYLTNVIDQVTALTNMASSVSAMTGAVAQISVLTNMGAQLAYLTNAMGSVQSLTNLTPQMAFLTNVTANTALQTAYLTNLLGRMGGLTNLTPQMGYLTNAVAQLQSLTNLNAQMAYVTNVIDQVTALTNMASSVSAMTGAVAQISGLTNMGDQLAFLTNAMGSVQSLTNLSPQMSFLTNVAANTALQTQYLTNLLGRMGGLTNLTPQMGYLTNAVAQLQSLTNLNAQMAYVTNVIDQVTALTNMASSVSAMTGAVAQISGLTNMGAQLNFLTNAMGSVQSLTNLSPQVASMTNLLERMSGLTNLTPQMAYLTNSTSLLMGLTNVPSQLSSMTNVINQLTGLTNISDQVAQMTNSISLIAGMTNLPSQMNYLTNVISQLTGLTNISSQVAAMTNSIGQIAGLTNLSGEMNYLTNAMGQFGVLTGLVSQVSDVSNSLTRLSGLTNLPGQVGYLTNLLTQMSSLTNINSQVAAMTNSIGQIAGMTNLPSQMNYLTNLLTQMSSLTNINSQVAAMTNSIGQIAGMTNLPSQMNYLTNLLTQMSSLTNINSQVAAMTNSIGLIAGMTNLPSQMNYMTNLLTEMSSLTNINAQVAAMTNSIGLIAGMTNLPGQMNYMTNLLTEMSSLTNINTQVAAMTNSIGLIAGMTNLPGQMNYMTNLLTEMSSLTNINSQVAAMTNSIGLIAGMTNLPGQMNYMTNLLTQMSNLTNINSQVAAMTNSIGQIAGMTNLPSQMNYLTNVISQMTSLTNINAQVAAMTNSIGLIAGMTNLPSQMNYLTNVISELTGLTNFSSQMAQVTNSIGLIAGMTNLTAQMNYLTNVINGLSGMTNISAQVAEMTNSISQLTGLTNIQAQVSSLTNLNAQMLYLTNAVGLLGGLSNDMAGVISAIGQLGSLTNLGSQVNVLTNSLGQVVALTNMSGQVAGLVTGLAQLTDVTKTISNTLASFTGTIGSLQNVSNSLSTVTAMTTSLSSMSTTYSNMYTLIEDGLGAATDTPDTKTVFGRIAAIEANVTAVGGQASAAAQRASGARSQANSAAGAAQRIKKDMAQSGPLDSVMTDVVVIRKALESALANLSAIPGELSTAEMVKTVQSAKDTINKISGGTVSGPGSKIEAGSPSDPKAVEALINQLSETKAMMQATRQLMDEAVNKPVVVDWLEGSK